MYREKELERITKEKFFEDISTVTDKVKKTKIPVIITSDEGEMVLMDFDTFQEELVWDEIK